MLSIVKNIFSTLLIVALLAGLRIFLQRLRFYKKDCHFPGKIIDKQTFREGKGLLRHSLSIVYIQYKVDEIYMEASIAYPGTADWAQTDGEVEVVCNEWHLKDPEIVGQNRYQPILRIIDAIILTALFLLVLQFIHFD